MNNYESIEDAQKALDELLSKIEPDPNMRGRWTLNVPFRKTKQ